MRGSKLSLLGFLFGSLLGPALLVQACAKETNVSDEENDSGKSGKEDSGKENDEEGGTDGSEEGTSDDSGEGGSGEQGSIPARGITISKVEVNSGAGADIYADGKYIPVSDRSSPIPKNRNTLIRVYVDVDDDDNWESRKMSARLTIRYDDGSEKEFDSSITVEHDSAAASIDSTFLFGILAEDVRPKSDFKVELLELDSEQDKWSGLDVPDDPPVAPADGEFERIGVESAETELKIVLVPVDYESEACSVKVDISEEALEPYKRMIFERNPISELKLEVHDYYKVDHLDLTQTTDFYRFLQEMVQLRAAENPEPNVYYYGLFDNCGECVAGGFGTGANGCILGVAIGTPGPEKESAGSRVSIGQTYLGNAPEDPSQATQGPGTFVHEVGHTQGRNHVECPTAQSAMPDRSFPHENGRLGSWGFGVLKTQFYNPTTHYDYMGYCSPTWVSDYQWFKTFLQISRLTAWDYEDGSEGEEVLSDNLNDHSGKLLMGAVNPETGESNWWTVAGGFTANTDINELHTFTFVTAGGEELVQSANVMHWSEGPWLTVQTPLPKDFDARINEVRYEAPHLLNMQAIERITFPAEQRRVWKAGSLRSND